MVSLSCYVRHILRPITCLLVTSAMALAAGKTEMASQEIKDLLANADNELKPRILEVERAVAAGDDRPLAGMIHTKWLLEKATSGAGDVEIKKAFAEGTEMSWRQRSLVADCLGSHFRFLRVQDLGGRSGLLFRATGNNGALNFYLYTLAKDEVGKPWVDDIFVVGLGEFMSASLQRGFKMLVDAESTGEAGKKAKEYLDNLPLIMKISASLREQNYPAVLALFQDLPTALQKERSLLLLRIEAAEHTSASERRSAMTDWVANYNDPLTLPLKLVDFYTAEGRFHQAENVLVALENKIGGDSSLKLRIGEMKLLQRRTDAAAAAAAKGEASNARNQPTGSVLLE